MIKVGTDFSGIGAPEQALLNLKVDFETVFACEIDKFARQSYKAIHQEPKYFFEDITKRDHKKIEPLDLYIAGFPCQAFSNNGKRKGFDEIRGTLFFNVADFIRVNRPKMFILENVKGLTNHDKGRTFQRIIDILTNGGGSWNKQTAIDNIQDGCGYHVYTSTVNSKEHGIPQNRERIFFVGFRDFQSFNFPKKEKLKKKLIDIIEENPKNNKKLSENETKSLILGKEKEKFKIKTNTLTGFDLAEHGDSINFGYHASTTRRGRVGKQISLTIDCGCEMAVVLNNKIRKLTALECWRLQNFPDEAYKKAAAVNSFSQLRKQAGNSITVRTIEKIIDKMLKT